MGFFLRKDFLNEGKAGIYCLKAIADELDAVINVRDDLPDGEGAVTREHEGMSDEAEVSMFERAGVTCED